MKPKNFWKKLKKPILALAPMAGFTNSAFRTICKEFGADVVYSEMASASALFFNPKKTLDLLKFSKKERPYVVQLFGNNPEHFAAAAKIISNPSPTLPLSKRREKIPDGIDINFGCPAPKVFKLGSGCALMRDEKLARKIIKAVCKNTNLPVSIKIRAGINPIKSPQSGVAKGEFNGVKNTTAIEFIKYIKDLPFSAVMVHGRTYEEGFSGPVDFEIIEKIKKIIPEKIVLANGGIDSPKDAKNVLEKYPELDGLGIARGALGRPHIFAEIKSLSRVDSAHGITTNYDFKKIMLRHAELVWQEKKSAGILELRKHLGWYVKGFPGASAMRQKLVRIKNLQEIKDILSCS